MDFHERMQLSHVLHDVRNPVRPELLAELGWAMQLGPGMRVLDIACGGGQLLVGWAKAHGISGIGLDISRWAIADAEARRQAEVPTADLEFKVVAGEEFETSERFDVVSLVGASWIWGGYQGTLLAMSGLAKPGGYVFIGEPFWRCEPDPEFLAGEGLSREEYCWPPQLLELAREVGLKPLYMLGASPTDYDRYESRGILAIDRWARANPDHPERDEVTALTEASFERFLRWGRDTVGFALLLFRVPEVEPRAR